MGENVCKPYVSDKELITKIYKEFKQPNSKKQIFKKQII